MALFQSKYIVVYLRMALASAYLSAVADRLGIWGAAGDVNVVWGNFPSFLEYTALLNPYCPAALIPLLGWGVTVTEVLLGITLILGIRIRESAIISGILLLCFAIGMIVGVGIKPPLDFSVFTASAASFLLAFQENYSLSVDSYLNHSQERKAQA